MPGVVDLPVGGAVLVRLVRLAEAAYPTNGPSLAEDPGAHGMEAAELLTHGTLEAWALADGDGRGVVAFRGTEASCREWLENVQADRVMCPLGLVHRGFWELLRPLAGTIHGWLADQGVREVDVTGHSRGAAVGILYAALRDDVRHVVVFGCPRVCSPDAVARYPWHGVTVRVENNADIVPRVPSAWRYRHVGRCLYHLRRGGWLVDPSWLTKWRDWRRTIGGSFVEMADDHRMVGYRLLAESMAR